MKDDEARYLIDQFNKYASWGARRDEVFTGAYFALGIACLAVVVSIWNQVLPTERRTSAFNIVLVVLLLLICVFFGSYLLVRRRYNFYERTLGMLEGYRSNHKSLPDGITLRLVIDKPEEVKKRLEQNESNLRTPPQT
jgi:amino acid permease